MYRLLLVNFSFVMILALVVATFITAKTYTQLGVAVILYPLLAFFAYKVFENSIWRPFLKKPQAAMQHTAVSEKAMPAGRQVEDLKKEGIAVSDIDKRLFLKIIGTTGLSFFLISIFGRRAENFLFGQNQTTQPAPAGKTVAASPSPTDGYTISEIDDGIVGYFGFINNEGKWFIMKRDTDSGSFRYAKGGKDFSGNWKMRENLKYDYFHNVFVY